jgi:hypothetical protein
VQNRQNGLAEVGKQLSTESASRLSEPPGRDDCSSLSNEIGTDPIPLLAYGGSELICSWRKQGFAPMRSWKKFVANAFEVIVGLHVLLTLALIVFLGVVELFRIVWKALL